MIGFVIQARTESTRYPNKIVLPFYESETIISLLINKLQDNFKLPVILATSTNPSNDILENIAKEKNISCFRGSENDVLQRFIDAGETNNLEYLIRVCSDNPFIDIDRIKLLISTFDSNNKNDYYSFWVNNSPSIKTHFGFWVEIVSLDALKKVKSYTNDSLYIEHVTNYIYTHPSLFKLLWLEEKLELNPLIRMTIDTEADFNLCSDLFKIQINNKLNLDNLIDYVSGNEEILNKMKKQIDINSK